MNPIGLPAFLYRILGRLTKFNHKIVKLIKDWFQQLRQYPAAEINHTSTTRQLETPGATINTVWSREGHLILFSGTNDKHQRNDPRLCDPLRTKRRASGRISKYCGRQHIIYVERRKLRRCLSLPQLRGSMIAYRPAKQ